MDIGLCFQLTSLPNAHFWPPSTVHGALIMPKAQHRLWHWDHYHDHPSFSLAPGGTEGFFGAPTGGKHKIYCKKCLDSHVASLAQEDADAVQLGQRMVARDQQQIEAYCGSRILTRFILLKYNTTVWTLKAEADSKGRGYISSAASTAINHLRFCTLVSADVRSTADEQHGRKYPTAPNSPTSQRRRRNTEIHIDTLGMPPPISLNSPDSSMAGPSMTQELQNLSQFNEFNPHSHPPSPSWPHHSPAPSESGSSGFSNSHPPSRSQSRSVQYRVSNRQSNIVDPALYWPKEKQNSFENRIARLTASAGFPLSWVDNMEWIDFCTEFLPAAKLPS
jgi:hypothetical protein